MIRSTTAPIAPDALDLLTYLNPHIPAMVESLAADLGVTKREIRLIVESLRKYGYRIRCAKVKGIGLSVIVQRGGWLKVYEAAQRHWDRMYS